MQRRQALFAKLAPHCKNFWIKQGSYLLCQLQCYIEACAEMASWSTGNTALPQSELNPCTHRPAYTYMLRKLESRRGRHISTPEGKIGQG